MCVNVIEWIGKQIKKELENPKPLTLHLSEQMEFDFLKPRNTEMMCKNCLYRVKGTHGDICEKNGKHLYWNKQDCPDHSEIKQPNHKETKTP